MTRYDSPTPLAQPLPARERDLLVRRTRSLLQAQVPLSLLLDLADRRGPDSSAVYAAEPADARWIGQRAG